MSLYAMLCHAMPASEATVSSDSRLHKCAALWLSGVQWVGYIKDYDGGTLMECVIVQRLPHTRLPAMLQAQKRALDSRIRQYSKSHFAHAGLSAFQEGCRRVDISSIPGQCSFNSGCVDAMYTFITVSQHSPLSRTPVLSLSTV